jgi:hypothetical protein
MGALGQGRTKLSSTTTTTFEYFLYKVQRPVTRVEPSELSMQKLKSCVTFIGIEEYIINTREKLLLLFGGTPALATAI